MGSTPGAGYTLRFSQPNAIDLIYAGTEDLLFWNPGGSGAPIVGGDGVWEIGGTSNNWTVPDGTVNTAFTAGAFAVFEGDRGTVTVDDTNGDVVVAGIQFATDGYVITGAPIGLRDGTVSIRVGDGTSRAVQAVATIESVITGTGHLKKEDAGILALTGNNTYTGGTTINAGTLRVFSDANLGDPSGQLAINRGTLQYGAGFKTSRATELLASDSTIDTQANNAEIAGIISGVGNLNKIGSGTLILSAENSFTGRTLRARPKIKLSDFSSL